MIEAESLSHKEPKMFPITGYHTARTRDKGRVLRPPPKRIAGAWPAACPGDGVALLLRRRCRAEAGTVLRTAPLVARAVPGSVSAAVPDRPGLSGRSMADGCIRTRTDGCARTGSDRCVRPGADRRTGTGTGAPRRPAAACPACSGAARAACSGSSTGAAGAACTTTASCTAAAGAATTTSGTTAAAGSGQRSRCQENRQEHTHHQHSFLHSSLPFHFRLL
jgi:hypothetical protein